MGSQQRLGSALGAFPRVHGSHSSARGGSGSRLAFRVCRADAQNFVGKAYVVGSLNEVENYGRTTVKAEGQLELRTELHDKHAPSRDEVALSGNRSDFPVVSAFGAVGVQGCTVPQKRGEADQRCKLQNKDKTRSINNVSNNRGEGLCPVLTRNVQ